MPIKINFSKNKEEKKQKPIIPRCNIDHAISRLKKWEENPQSGVRLKMHYDNDKEPLYVMFSFQHSSGPTRATPIELWDKDFLFYFDQAERIYLDYAKKADSVDNYI